MRSDDAYISRYLLVVFSPRSLYQRTRYKANSSYPSFVQRLLVPLQRQVGSLPDGASIVRGEYDDGVVVQTLML